VRNESRQPTRRELADATYHAALQRDITSMVDRFLESRPEQKRHYEGLVTARQEAAATEQELWPAKAYPLRTPAELNTPDLVG
jgi:hypothetical protein